MKHKSVKYDLNMFFKIVHGYWNLFHDIAQATTHFKAWFSNVNIVETKCKIYILYIAVFLKFCKANQL